MSLEVSLWEENIDKKVRNACLILCDGKG